MIIKRALWKQINSNIRELKLDLSELRNEIIEIKNDLNEKQKELDQFKLKEWAKDNSSEYEDYQLLYKRKGFDEWYYCEIKRLKEDGFFILKTYDDNPKHELWVKPSKEKLNGKK